MAVYRVRSEYVDKWSNDSEWADNPIVDEAEIERLAREWEVPIDDLMEQVERIEPKVAD